MQIESEQTMSDTPSTDNEKEELILKSVRLVLLDVIKDTTTTPGMPHPLSENTINEMRQCLHLITNRQKELAELQGKALNMRPVYVDEKPRNVVVPFPGSDKSET